MERKILGISFFCVAIYLILGLFQLVPNIPIFLIFASMYLMYKMVTSAVKKHFARASVYGAILVGMYGIVYDFSDFIWRILLIIWITIVGFSLFFGEEKW